MSDGKGPGRTCSTRTSSSRRADAVGVLHVRLFVGNRADRFPSPPSPAGLDFTTPALNQQVRVDILRAATDPFSVATADVLITAYQTQTTDPLVSGYTSFTVNVSSLMASQAGQTLRLRFAEIDNLNFFQFGVDNVSLVASVPEPSSVVMMGSGLMGATGVLVAVFPQTSVVTGRWTGQFLVDEFGRLRAVYLKRVRTHVIQARVRAMHWTGIHSLCFGLVIACARPPDREPLPAASNKQAGPEFEPRPHPRATYR